MDQLDAEPDKDLELLHDPSAALPENPSEAKIELFPNPCPGRNYWVRFECLEFTCLRPVLKQPDFGRVRIEYIPGTQCLESKSVKFYLSAYRNEVCFIEMLVNRVLEDLKKACQPRRIVVQAEFAEREGMSLSAVAEWPDEPAESSLRPHSES